MSGQCEELREAVRELIFVAGRVSIHLPVYAAEELSAAGNRATNALLADTPSTEGGGELEEAITALIKKWLCTNLALCRASIGRPPGHGAEEEAQRDVVDALGAVWLAGVEYALTPRIMALLTQHQSEPPATTSPTEAGAAIPAGVRRDLAELLHNAFYAIEPVPGGPWVNPWPLLAEVVYAAGWRPPSAAPAGDQPTREDLVPRAWADASERWANTFYGEARRAEAERDQARAVFRALDIEIGALESLVPLMDDPDERLALDSTVRRMREVQRGRPSAVCDEGERDGG